MNAEQRPTVIAVVGPTASGKTALSLAIAESFGGEIIAADSRTVYRHFDIGTAKPSAAEQARIRHHAIDVAEPEENFTAAQFAELGSRAIAEISARGKLPIVAGGTGFYTRALLEGLVIPSVPPQEELRQELRRFADQHGNEALHARLQEVDPQTAARLNPNDRFRIIRALEVHATTGEPMSSAAKKTEPPFRTVWIGLTAENRALLHESIRKRFAEQMDEGMMAETQRLYERYGPSQKLMHTVNYKQLVQLIEGKLDEKTAHEQAVHHNIQLARRQLIWFRANPAIKWFLIDSLSKAELAREVASHIKDALA